MIALLILFITLGLACAILLPGDPARRGQRTRRVIAATAAFCLTMGLSAVIADARADSPANLPVLATILRWAMTFPFQLIPFALADRLAGLLGARRRPSWALAAVAFATAWVAVIDFLLLGVEIGSVSWPDMAFGLILPGLAAGFAWFVMLVDRREQVGAIFE